MESQDLMRLIQVKFPKLSKGQKLIAEYILKNYDKAAFMTAAKLGNNVGVSESTVVRFATELGFSGYPKLQKALQELIKNKLTSVQRLELSNDFISEENALKGVLKADMENIRSTMEKIDYNTFEDEFYILQKRFSNIVFSYNTACYLWGLSDRAPYKMEVTTLSHNNINENIDIHYVNEEKFNIGITTLTSPCGNPIIIYNQERCICDIIKNKNSVDAELYNKIIKNYFKQKNKNLERLEEYSKIFNVYEKVIDIMEVLM